MQSKLTKVIKLLAVIVTDGTMKPNNTCVSLRADPYLLFETPLYLPHRITQMIAKAVDGFLTLVRPERIE